MIQKHTHRSVTWIDLENPTTEEVRQIMDEYSINPIVGDEMLAPTLRPKVDYFGDYIYLILHFPSLNSPHDQEIDFVIGKDIIITTHYDPIDGWLDFSKMFDVDSILDRGLMGDHAGFLFFYMIRHQYRSVLDQIENMTELLYDAEENIFNGKEKEMVFELSHINRTLLNFRASARLHREVLESFEIAGSKLFGTDFSHYLRSIIGEYYKVEAELESNKEYLRELRSTNDSLLTTKQNEIIKFLTIISFVTFPLMLVSSLFGMNTEATPIVGRPDDFWMVILIMLVLSIMMFILFRIKKWI